MHKRAESLQSPWREVTSRSLPARRIRKGRAARWRESTELRGDCPPSRGTPRSCSRSWERQKGRGKPSSFGASCATLLPLACVPEASAPTLGFPAAGLPGPRTDGVPFALSLQRVPFVLPSPQVASLPFSHSQRVRGLSFPSHFYSCGVHLKVLKLAL